ncbi:glycosyltransferase 61 family protein [Variovorax boronicumulans]|uniref:glycosyltransferase family 61 protein n=1 Tax=Variovorax boronicumulans TaxID=436515 RepID=UPI0036F3DA32
MLSRIIRRLTGRSPSVVDARQPLGPAPVAAPPEAVRKVDIYAEHAKWMALAGERRFGEAISLCRTVIDVPESNFVASLFLGHAYAQMQQHADAREYLRAAVALNGNDYYANLLLAHTESAMGHSGEALSLYMRCCELPVESIVEPFEAAMRMAMARADSGEGAALSRLFDMLYAKDKLPLPLALKFLFFWRRDADLARMLEQMDEGADERQKPSFRRIRSVKDWALENGEGYQSLGAPPSIRLVAPTEVYASDPHEQHVLASQPYLAELRNARIVSASSLVYVGDDCVVSDVLADELYGKQVSLAYDKTVLAQRPDALLLAPIGTTAHLDEGIMLSGLASNAYGHWFAEFLPKLRHFEKHPRFSSLPIIVDAEMPASHFDFIAALVGNPLYRLEAGHALNVGRLHVAPTTTFFPVELFRDHTVPPERQASWSAESMQYIKDKMAARYPLPAQRSRRLFLSRKNSAWRLLRNEAEIIERLQDLGFESIFLEEYDFARQVRTFGEAEFIVAPNGSALNSLIFAATDVKALILGQQNSFNWGGWLGPILDLGFKPEFMEGEATESTSFKHSDYVVPADRVRTKVLAMLGS